LHQYRSHRRRKPIQNYAIIHKPWVFRLRHRVNTVTGFADFASIQTGDTISIHRRIEQEDVRAFASLSGDHNPLHMDVDFARRTRFQRPVAHGMLVASFVSTLVGMHLPGRGALWTQQLFRWRKPAFVGDELEISLTVVGKSAATRTLKVEVKTTNQEGSIIMDGEGSVMVLEEREEDSDLPLSARVALVTGSSRGIGSAIAAAIAAAGASVVVNYNRSATQAEEACHTICQNGGIAIAVRADVTDASAVNAMVEQAREKLRKPVDVLINNASGPIQARPFDETSWQDIQAHLNVQVQGAFNCCKAVLPAMLEQQSGRIVNIGSIAAINVPPREWTGYVLAKSALHALTRSLAVELGQKGIRVNMVSPGMTETTLIAEVPDRLRKVQAMQTPLRRLSLPSDIANAVVFLCSNAADFITGADIPVCGGVSM
jgi:3-oxoacyl-[acyl-carrier protein] reductase